MGDCPHQPIEVLVTCGPQIKVGHRCLYHSGVGFGPPLPVGLKGQFLCDILAKKAQDVYCSDITNTLVGISGETAPVARILPVAEKKPV